MAVERYDQLLQEISDLIEVPDLKPDASNTCMITLPSDLEVYMEFQEEEDFFLLGAMLGEVPPGALRIGVLKAAMQENGKDVPLVGNFAFNDENAQIFFFKRWNSDAVTAREVANTWAKFIPKAEEWREALQRGEAPYVEGTTTAAGGPGGGQQERGGMFGLKT